MCSTPCATAASAARPAPTASRLGDYDIGLAVGLDKHPKGVHEDPALVGMPRWYAENGAPDDAVLRHEGQNRYIHDHGISQRRWRVANKNFRNGVLNPECVIPPQGDKCRGDLNSTHVELPVDAVHTLAPDEGAAAVVMCRADIATGTRQTRLPQGRRGAHPHLWRLRGQHHVRAGRGGRRAHRVRRPRHVSKRPVSHRKTST